MKALLNLLKRTGGTRVAVLFFCLLAPGGVRAQVPRYHTPKVGDLNTNLVAVTNVSREFEKDALELIARIEGWDDLAVAEVEEKISREWLRYMLSYVPPLPKEEVDCIVQEFKPKASEAFREGAAMVIGQHFTHEDVRQLIAFYKTPLGRKYAAAYQDVCAKMLAGDLRREILRNELVDRVRKRFPDAF